MDADQPSPVVFQIRRGFRFQLFSLRISGAALGEQSPMWLAPVRFFAIVSGPSLVASGIWLLFRR